jgi:4-amino-4-deoxy-L-arabinose transferase-like glycosyltransferase
MDKTWPGCNHRSVRKRPIPDPVIALLFFTAALLTRLPSIPRSVLDWDESLYFLMARQWRLGHLPYTTIWDNKPVGIYGIFAVFQAVFGDRVAAIRIATIMFVSLLAFTVYKITQVITANRGAALLAGGALILCSLSNDGLSANTELFMASFTALAVLAALTTGWGFVAGLCLGAAFMIKYVAVFEAPVVLGLLLWRQRRVSAGVACLAGAAVPLAAAILLYAHAGRLGLWWDCSVASNFRRVDVPITNAALDYAFRTELLRWGPLYLAGLGIICLAFIRRRGMEIFLAGWLAGGMVGVVSSKSFYDHYFLQLLPVLCVVLGFWFNRLGPNHFLRAGFVLVFLALPAWAAKTALRDTTGPDVPRLVAADVKAENPASIYVFDFQPIIYALAGQTPPTRYVLPSELTKNFLPRIAGVDAPAEMARILATNPVFIIRLSHTDPAAINPVVYAELDQALTARYHLWRRYEGVAVYRLK